MAVLTIVALHHRSAFKFQNNSYQQSTLDQSAGVGYDPIDLDIIRCQFDFDVVNAIQASSTVNSVHFLVGLDHFTGTPPVGVTFRASTGPISSYGSAQALHTGAVAGGSYGVLSVGGDIDKDLGAGGVADVQSIIDGQSGLYSMGVRATDESGTTKVSGTFEGLDYIVPASRPRLVVNFTPPTSGWGAEMLNNNAHAPLHHHYGHNRT